jgi:hypothetical protein
MDDYQIQSLENQQVMIDGQETITDHVYGILENTRVPPEYYDKSLDQLVMQTEIEFMMLVILVFVMGMWLFSWGVKLWKRWWL